MRSILLGLGLQFGKFNGETIVEKGFKTVTVSTTPSTRDCTQCLSIERSNSKFSDDELKALGLTKSENNREKKVQLVMGLPIQVSLQSRMPSQQENLEKFFQESYIPLNVEQEPKVLLIRTKSDLMNPEWVKEFIFSVRGGQEIDEALVKSILSKVSDSHFSIPSANKILLRLAEAVASNQELLRLLAELEKPFYYSALDGMEALSSYDILRLPEAQSFGLMPNPNLPPYQQRAKTHVLSAQGKTSVSFITPDGTQVMLREKSTNHLLSKHGDSLGIDDPLPPNPNQKTKKHKQIRTRINKKNKQQFEGILEKILQNPTTEVFPDVSIRGIRGQVYVTEDYGGFLIGIHTEGEFAGQIMKAQPISDPQLEMLHNFNKID